MTKDERMRLGKILAATAFYYNRQITPDVVTMMLDDLDDLPFEQTASAYQKYRLDAKNRFFPLPAQIREILTPQVDADAAAKEIASRIMAAVTKFGYSQRSEALAYIGPIGAEIVNRYGGWQRLCETLGDSLDVGTFQAQVRDLARAQVQYGPKAIEQAVLNAWHEKRGELHSAKEILNLIQGKTTNEPN